MVLFSLGQVSFARSARTEAGYWPAEGVGVGEGVGDDDIIPFATCSPPSFAPVSASELALGFGMSAPAAMHAEMQVHARMNALNNRKTVFIRLDFIILLVGGARRI